MITIIESKNNQILKRVRSLSRRKYRDLESSFVVEGRTMVAEGLQFAKKPLFLVIAQSFISNAENKNLLAIGAAKNLKIYQVSDKIFEELSQVEETQGILLVLSKEESGWDNLIKEEESLLLILDGIQDPGNLGTIIRTGVAVGAEGIVLTKGSVDLYNEKTLRSTMGAIFKTKLMQDLTYQEIIKFCQEFDFPIVVADPKGDRVYTSWDFTKKTALVIGNETHGPSPILMENAKGILTVPMFGEIESLNAGVAAGILMYERVRQKIKDS